MMLGKEGQTTVFSVMDSGGSGSVCVCASSQAHTVYQSCQLLLPFYLDPVNLRFVLSSWKRAPFVFFPQIGEVSWQSPSKAVKTVASWKFGSKLSTRADLNISFSYFHRQLLYDFSPLYFSSEHNHSQPSFLK